MPTDARFKSTGLERAQALAADLAWFKETYGLDAPALEEDGPGVRVPHSMQARITLWRGKLA
jgi:hypothetical protein